SPVPLLRLTGSRSSPVPSHRGRSRAQSRGSIISPSLSMPLVLPPDMVVPFPRTLRWSATLHETERSNFEPFHRNVSSQLKEATDSTRRLVKIFWNPEWQPDFDARTARLVS